MISDFNSVCKYLTGFYGKEPQHNIYYRSLTCTRGSYYSDGMTDGNAHVRVIEHIDIRIGIVIYDIL